MTNRLDTSRQLVLGEIITRWANKIPDQEAIVFKDRRVTYGKLNDRVNRLANGLVELGVKKGDNVAALFMNCVEILEVYFALCKIGAVVVPLNFRLAVPEVEYLIRQSDAVTIIFDKMFQEVINCIRIDTPNVENYICLGGKAGQEIIDYSELLNRNSSDEPAVLVDDDNPAFIIYTSGTTGRPKGAVLSHKSVILSTISTVFECQLQKSDRTALSAPLFHVAALMQTLASLFLGDTCFISDVWDPQAFLKILVEEQITVAQLLPVMWIELLNLPDINKYNTRSLRVVLTSASSMPVELIKKAKKIFPNVGIYDLFGQTESGGPVTYQKPDNMISKLGSVGQRGIFTESRIVDNNGHDVPMGEIGEIITRGPLIMKEYYNNPRATAEVFREGWLYSGDLVQEDKDGFIYITGRKTDMIISGGENIYPAEVEQVLYMLPDIFEVSVIGVPDLKWGEVVKAIIVLKQGKTLTEDEIIKYCKQNLASYKKPTSIEFIKSLPRNATGKVLKYKLKKMYDQ